MHQTFKSWNFDVYGVSLENRDRGQWIKQSEWLRRLSAETQKFQPPIYTFADRKCKLLKTLSGVEFSENAVFTVSV